jgi:2-polyprenyl-3-methyl-5-hydroxy-6-metoxy-1,4-benzoquinol methylase
MKKTWGAEIWEEKIKAQDAVGVIMGTGFTRADMDRHTVKTMELLGEFFFKTLPVGASILDVGTGPAARFAIAMSKLGYRVTGLDGSATSLAAAKAAAKGSGAEFVQADFSDFKLDKTFDGLVCIETFYHLPAHLAMSSFTCFNRVLKPGAHAMVQFSVLNEPSLGHMLWNLFYFTVYRLAGPILKMMGRRSFVVTVTRNTSAEIEDIGQRTGFEIVWEKNGVYIFQKIREI